MMSNESPQIVAILTPPQTHASLALKAIEKEANILVEKPLTMTTQDAQLILASLKGSSVKMTVVYHYLFSQVMQRALGLVNEGSIGVVLGMSVVVLEWPEDDVMGSNPKLLESQYQGRKI